MGSFCPRNEDKRDRLNESQLSFMSLNEDREGDIDEVLEAGDSLTRDELM